MGPTAALVSFASGLTWDDLDDVAPSDFTLHTARERLGDVLVVRDQRERQETRGVAA